MALSIIFNRLFLVFLVLFLGTLLGKLKIGKVGFGASGPLFVGIGVGWLIITIAKSIPETSEHYDIAQTLISSDVVPNEYFILFLSLFICSVGLLASKNLRFILKKYGAKFIILGVVITLVGAVSAFGMISLSKRYQAYELVGAYPGALTSNPGLASALDTADTQTDDNIQIYEDLDYTERQDIMKASGSCEVPAQISDTQAQDYKRKVEIAVGVSHTVSYPFGVCIVLLAIIFLPKIFRINIDDEKKKFAKEMQHAKNTMPQKRIVETVPFDVIAFGFILVTGRLIGLIVIPLPFLGSFSLGSVGGILIMSLLFGSFGKIGFLNFNMEEKVLVALQRLSVSFIFTVIGLRFGFHVVESLSSGGIYVALVAVVVALVSITTGFLIGHFIFKINWILLSGALCGGMTSTPGLSIAVDSIDSNDPAVGYGATYPIALICMITFTIILNILLI